MNVLIKNTENCLFPSFFTRIAILLGNLVVLCSKVDFTKKLGTLLNPFAPGNFAKKCLLK